MKIVQTKKGSEWGSVHIDGVGDFEGLIGIEELKDYEITEPEGKTTNELKKTEIKKKRKKKKHKQLPKQTENEEVEKEDKIEHGDILPWTNIFVPDEIAESLVEQGFMNPTDIQRLCIPAAVRGRKDILGAAETGSGKTLAFGIPMLHGILKCLEKGSLNQDDDSDDEPPVKSEKCVKVINLNSEERIGSLLGLVLAPTRELALQVKNHLDIASRYTSVKVATVVGGMSVEKQIRILKKKPHLLVATPGRLWELMNYEAQLVNLNNVRFFAIDETDRMLEKDHFPELRSILEILQEQKNIKRQNFVFSATLTLVHEPPTYIKRKRHKKAQLTQSDKLNHLIKVVGMKDYKIVDITRKTGTAEALREAKISCTFEEKDYFIYYLLKAYFGRTVIFCNSISCVKRLASLLGLLSCAPIPLHANMQQRQRLKNLDRFRKEENSTLLSTDVAARGLDIPNIEHVIHYQVPRTSEGYVHRSGRTARAASKGLTVLLIEPSEIKNYIKICRTLDREMDFDEFPVDQKILSEAKARVKIAREVDFIERKLSKIKSNSSWLEKSAAELDIVVDEEEMPKKLDNKQLSSTKNHLLMRKKCLSKLLSTPFINKGSAMNTLTTSETKKKSVRTHKLLKKKIFVN